MTFRKNTIILPYQNFMSVKFEIAKLQRFLSGSLKTDTAGFLIFFLTEEDSLHYNWSDSWSTKLLRIFW